eukprot:683830-Prorocentrum_minimum.AAC.1
MVLYRSAALEGYPYDVCSYCYSPPVQVDLLVLDARAPARLVVELHNDARNAQVLLPLEVRLSWENRDRLSRNVRS